MWGRGGYHSQILRGKKRGKHSTKNISSRNCKRYKKPVLYFHLFLASSAAYTKHTWPPCCNSNSNACKSFEQVEPYQATMSQQNQRKRVRAHKQENDIRRKEKAKERKEKHRKKKRRRRRRWRRERIAQQKQAHLIHRQNRNCKQLKTKIETTRIIIKG